MDKKIIVIGAGGHAKVVTDILLQQIKRGTKIEIIGILDDSYEEGQEKKLFDIPVIGKVDKALELTDAEFIIAIGSNEIRKKIAMTYSKLKYYTAIHPTAIMGERVEIGTGTVVMAGVVVNSYSKVSDHCILNSRSVIEHDCEIKAYAHISPNATLCGGVEVGEESWIGAGSTVIQGMKISNNVMVGAGSIVIRDVKSNSKIIGVSGRSR